MSKSKTLDHTFNSIVPPFIPVLSPVFWGVGFSSTLFLLTLFELLSVSLGNMLRRCAMLLQYAV